MTAIRSLGAERLFLGAHSYFSVRHICGSGRGLGREKDALIARVLFDVAAMESVRLGRSAGTEVDHPST
ncbi:MAG: hypothetical protein AAGA55_09170, partial [Planctomycetota bacterium]